MSRSAIAWTAVLLALLGPGTGVSPIRAQAVGADNGEVAARVWLDRGDEPLLQRGEQVRIYYRTNVDAYVAIFNIDTNGTVRLLFPRSPDEGHYVRGGHDYRLLFPGSEYWHVDDPPGMGYFFLVASPQPFDFASFAYSYYDRGWDLTQVGQSVYTDPYVAMDDYVAALLPDWQAVPYALDFSTYHVGDERHDYPRFLCYDCHGFRPYTVWNPYLYTCTNFRVVVYTDPWYYPSFRYRGDRVVYARPPRPWTPRYEFKERADGDPPGVQYVVRPPVADRPGVAGDPALRRSARPVTGRDGAAVGEGVPANRLGVPIRGIPGDVITPRRGVSSSASAPSRPTAILPGREGTGAEGAEPRRVVPPTGTGSRPTLERRGAGEGGGSTGTDGGTVRPTRPGDGGGARGGTRGGSGSDATRRSTPTTRVPVPRPAGDGGGRIITPDRPSGPGAGSDASSGRSTRPSGRATSGRSSPTIRREDDADRRWVPVLGGGGSEEARPTSSGGQRGAEEAGEPGDAAAVRPGTVFFEGTRGSPGYTVTREGGMVILRGRPSGSGSSRASGGSEAATAASRARDRASAEAGAGAARTPASARPSARVVPSSGRSRAGGTSSAGRSDPVSTRRPAATSRPQGGAGATRSTGNASRGSIARGASSGRSGASAGPTVRRSGGSASVRSSGGSSSRRGGGTSSGAVVRRSGGR